MPFAVESMAIAKKRGWKEENSTYFEPKLDLFLVLSEFGVISLMSDYQYLF